MASGEFKFIGPNIQISCEVRWDDERHGYVAEREGFVGFSGQSPASAALNCFRAWVCDEGGYYRAAVIRR